MEQFDLSNYLGSNVSEESSTRVLLEITLSHPRCSLFKRMTDDQQKVLYCTHLKTMYDASGLIIDSTAFFERSNDGNLHCHARVTSYVDLPFYPEGLVQTCVKSLFSCLPKRYCTPRWDTDYNAVFKRYKSPMICVQYRGADESERDQYWSKYIIKSQPLV